MFLQRNYHQLAGHYLKTFPVLCVLGPRQAGKTLFAKRLAAALRQEGREWHHFDLEKPSDYELITTNPELFFEQYPACVIIDGAQEYPALFKILRGVIDSNGEQKGRFILTGSSSPTIRAHLSDSLAGRVGMIQMGTLKANEFYQKPLSDFYHLFSDSQTKETISLNQPTLTNAEMRHLWLYGGYPEPLLAGDPVFYQDWMSQYHATYINRDISHLFPKLNRMAYQRFIGILSSLSGTIINKADLARSVEISEASISEYLQIAEQTYLWRNIAYDSTSTVKSIVKRPKGILTDTGLQHYLKKITDHEQLLRHPHCGRSFESFVIEEIIKGIAAAGIHNVDFNYYRTAKGAEVDLIVTTPSSKIPIEIKMAKSVNLKQLSALTKYIEDSDLPFGLLINQSEKIFWMTNKILQVPIGVL